MKVVVVVVVASHPLPACRLLPNPVSHDQATFCRTRRADSQITHATYNSDPTSRVKILRLPSPAHGPAEDR